MVGGQWIDDALALRKLRPHINIVLMAHDVNAAAASVADENNDENIKPIRISACHFAADYRQNKSNVALKIERYLAIICFK